ncbi:MAG TPA: SDR family NAD-dependent epimerase/dehydratase, partial [Candidatus Brocadiia bacterium]|nr:SDR family NAD-dependent epimerase/dehydratase [Candidatus Brocadiia bacterium]
DITRAKKILGWEPKVPRKVGLARTLEYFRQELKL